jgi:hypothetical protein
MQCPYSAERGKPQVEIRCTIGISKDMNDHAFPYTEAGSRPPLRIATFDGYHLAQQFAGRNRRIVVPEPIAAGDKERTLRAVRAAHHSVREHSPIAHIQHNLSIGNFRQDCMLDGNQIAGKNGRHHACPEHAKTNSPECADYISRQTARQCRHHMLPRVHTRPNRRAMRLSLRVRGSYPRCGLSCRTTAPILRRLTRT